MSQRSIELIALQRRTLVAAAIGVVLMAAGLILVVPRLLAPTAISVTRGACYGECPEFSFTAHANGQLDYKGEVWVVRRGTIRATIDPAQYSSLVALMGQIRPLAIGRYDEAGSNCPGGVGVDAPTADVIWWWGSLPLARLQYDEGCAGPDTKRIGEVLHQTDAIPAIRRLIGTEAQRKALPSGIAGNPCREFDFKSPACRRP